MLWGAVMPRRAMTVRTRGRGISRPEATSSGHFVRRAHNRGRATSQLIGILQAGAAAGVGVGVGVADVAISLCRLTESPLVSAS